MSDLADARALIENGGIIPEPSDPPSPYRQAIESARELLRLRKQRSYDEIPLGGYNMADIMDENEPDVDWIVDNVLQTNAVGVIGAEYKGCKSWLGCALALSLSSNTPFLGQFDVKRPGWVLYIAMEDSRRNMKSRLRSMAFGHQLDPKKATARINAIPRPPTLNIATEEGQAWVVAHASRMPERPVAVILDPMGNTHQAKNENDAAEMTPVMNGFRSIRDALDCSVVAPHHMGKPSGESKGGNGRIEHRLRGSSAIFQSVDQWMLLDLKKEEQTKEYRIWRNALVIGTREGGGAKLMAELDVRLKPNGTAKTSSWTIIPEDADELDASKRVADSMVGRSWLTTPQIAASADVPERTTRLYLNKMEAQGLVERNGKSRSTEWRLTGSANR